MSFEPVQNYYDAGTQVTLRAQARPDYFFQSWSGGALGDTVKARTLGELQALLGDDVPRVVTFSG